MTIGYRKGNRFLQDTLNKSLTEAKDMAKRIPLEIKRDVLCFKPRILRKGQQMRQRRFRLGQIMQDMFATRGYISYTV